MLWTIVVVLAVLWLLGLLAHIGGGLIHMHVVVLANIFIYNLVVGRRTV